MNSPVQANWNASCCIDARTCHIGTATQRQENNTDNGNTCADMWQDAIHVRKDRSGQCKTTRQGQSVFMQDMAVDVDPRGAVTAEDELAHRPDLAIQCMDTVHRRSYQGLWASEAGAGKPPGCWTLCQPSPSPATQPRSHAATQPRISLLSSLMSAFPGASVELLKSP